MPIQQQTITPDQFDYLQDNITSQSQQFNEAAVLAQSGLEYVVLLQTVAPEVDLVTQFASHLSNIEGLDSTANFLQVVSSLNSHLIARGTTLRPGDSNTIRLNRWLSGQEQLIPDGSGGVEPDPSATPVLVSTTYARISSGAGFFIDPCNIAPGDTCPDF